MIVNIADKRFITDIETFLLRQTPKLPKTYFLEKYGVDAEKNTLDLIRYIVEGVFHWTPLEAGDYLTDQVLESFNVTQYLKHIKFPPGVGRNKSGYILSLLYPSFYKFNKREHYISIYNDVLTKKGKFPKNFFNGYASKERAEVCLQHLINSHLFAPSIEELYELFGKKEITAILKKYQLLTPCQSLYINPIDYLHETLPTSQKDNFLYHYYSFMFENKKALSSYLKGNVSIKKQIINLAKQNKQQQ